MSINHKPYIRIIEGSRYAVLMIHGIAGTPAHFRDLLPIIPENWSVYNILLDGHGGTVKDFGCSSMKKWKSQTEATLQEIFQTHEKVLLVAHSMGTLFSIQSAIAYPDKISALFLLAVPLRPWVRFSTVLTSLRIALQIAGPEDKAANAMKSATGTALGGNPLHYIRWLPRLVELLTETHATRKCLPQLHTLCQCYQSRIDELVSIRSNKDLQANPCIRLTVLEHSGHFQYGESDMRLLQSELRGLIDSMDE